MRDILFRGKRTDTGQWVFGQYFARDDYTVILTKKGAVYKGRNQFYHVISLNAFDVDPDTVGQYTGLTDKNGKKIFEGDIVFNNMTGRKLIGYLEERAAFCFCDKCITSPAFIGQYNFEYFEVIGNIHDNPELLEVGELARRLKV